MLTIPIEYWIYFGVFVQSIGTLTYAYLTLKGEVQPNRMTWFIWALAPMLAGGIAWYEGVGIVALPVFSAGFFPFIVFIASFFNPKAYWKLGTLDYIAGASALVALFFWAFLQSTSLAIILLVLANALAFFPTLIKAWKFPKSESSWSYSGTVISSGIGLFAVENWITEEYAFLLYTLIFCIVAVVYIERKRFSS